MIVRKADFTVAALELGLWETLCDMAGVSTYKRSREMVEIDVSKAEIVCYNDTEIVCYNDTIKID
jgi:hypothetical protein